MTDYEALIAEGRIYPKQRVAHRLADAVETLLAIEQRLSDHIVQLAAERDAALLALAESRARFADSEARRAALEAVIEKVRGELHHAEDNGHHLSADCQGVAPGEHAPAVRLSNVEAALSTARSVVLEDRDREVAARALEDAAAVIPEQMRMDELGMHQVTYTHELPELPLVMLNGGTRFAERLVERAAAIRKGDTNA